MRKNKGFQNLQLSKAESQLAGIGSGGPGGAFNGFLLPIASVHVQWNGLRSTVAYGYRRPAPAPKSDQKWLHVLE